MRIEFVGIEFVLRRIKGNNDNMVIIPLKDYQNMQRQLKVMLLKT